MRVAEARVPLTGASDHGVSEAVYLADPDQNGIELYWDRPREEWPRTPDGGMEMFTQPLDLQDLLAQAEARLERKKPRPGAMAEPGRSLRDVEATPERRLRPSGPCRRPRRRS